MLRMLLFVLLMVCVCVGAADGARQFNGTSQCAYTTSSLDFSALGTHKIALSFWLYWDSFANDDDMAVTSGAPSAKAVEVVPNDSGFSALAVYTYSSTGTSSYNGRTIPRPSAATWHHYVLNLDGTVTDAPNQIQGYLDGAGSSPTTVSTTGDNHDWGNLVWSLMGRTCGGTPALLGAGRIAEVAIWTNITLSSTDATALWNGGAGVAATTVQSGNLAHYWQLCGTASPEPATVGTVSLTLVGAPTQVAHPVGSTCGAAGPPVVRRKGTR